MFSIFSKLDNKVFAQETFSVQIFIDYTILNSDTICKDSMVERTIKSSSVNKIYIWNNELEAVGAVIDVHKKNDKIKLKIRFDKKNGEKWKKPKLDFWCDGLYCSFNRWYSKGKTVGALMITSTEKGFSIKKVFSESNNSLIVSGRIKIIY